MEITWIQPDLGLVDVTGPGRRLRFIESDQCLLDVPHNDTSRIRLKALADPERRQRLRLEVAGRDAASTTRPVGLPQEGVYPPAWSLGAVWYQVFPDRFDNGNRDNDPPSFDPGWSTTWTEVSVEELESSRAARRAQGRHASHRISPLSHVVYERRYGGDLQGVVRRLGHITDLGATAIYLNPVFEAHSLHKYDATDHRHVDPTLGAPDLESPPVAGESADPATWTWTPADRYVLDTLLPAARARNLRVVFDGVWNHVGTRHWAFQDVLRQGRGSEFAEWFQVRLARQPGDPPVIAWRAWDGANGSLPAFRQTEEGDLVAPVKAHVAAVTRRWMDPDDDGDPVDGIDGWRLDVVPDVGLRFWRDWNELVRSINPDAVTIAEVWHHADKEIEQGGFTAQMNYPVRDAVLAWLSAEEGYDGAVLTSMLERALDFDDRVNLAQMNLLGSHDTARVVTHIAAARGESPHARPSKSSYELALLGVAIQVALPGAPSVYNGDEWGVWGADDPHNRKPVPWPDAGPYDQETAPFDWVKESMSSWLRRRHDEVLGPVLRYGAWSLDAPERDLLVVDRQLNGIRVRFIANRSARTIDVSDLVAGYAPRDLADALPARSAAMWILK